MTRPGGWSQQVLADTAPRFDFRLISPSGFIFPAFGRKKLSHHWTGGPRGCPYFRDEIFLRWRRGFGTAIAMKKKCFSRLNLYGFGVSR
jgi:hypothetical protein